MKKQITTIFLFLWISNSNAQNFISDSLMSIYVESGVADKYFMPKGKSKDDERVGKWIDYTFEFIFTYQKRDENTVDEYLEHLLIHSSGNFIANQKEGLWIFSAVEEGTFKKHHIADVTYNKGKKEGPITFFYTTGEKASEGNYENDILQGLFKVYYQSGEIERVYHIEDDKIQGLLTHFYKSGEKKYTINFINGIRQGEAIGYHINGKIKSERKYINDTLQGKGVYYYSDGAIQEEGIYKDGMLATLKYYYQSGQLWVNKDYRDGNYYNVLELYDSHGNPLDPGTLKDGTGTVKYYTEDAKVYLIRTFSNGEIIKEEHFD